MLPRRPSPTLQPSSRIESTELCLVSSNGLRHSIVVHQKDDSGEVQKPQGKGWQEKFPPSSSHITKFRTNAGTIVVPAATARDHLGKLQTGYLSLYFLCFLTPSPLCCLLGRLQKGHTLIPNIRLSVPARPHGARYRHPLLHSAVCC